MSRFPGRLSLVLLGLLCAVSPAVAQPIAWRHDYAAARREAQQQGRPLLLDFGTSNCFWCVKLDQTTFADPAMQQLIGTNFIAVKVHADKEPALTQGLGIQSFPTLVFAGHDGKILGRHEGYIEVPALTSQLQAILAAAAPARRPEPVAAAPASPPPPRVHLTIPPPESAPVERQRLARELLDRAKGEWRSLDVAACFDHCEELRARYADLPEAEEARRLQRVLVLAARQPAAQTAHDQPAPKVRAQSP